MDGSRTLPSTEPDPLNPPPTPKASPRLGPDSDHAPPAYAKDDSCRPHRMAACGTPSGPPPKANPATERPAPAAVPQRILAPRLNPAGTIPNSTPPADRPGRDCLHLREMPWPSENSTEENLRPRLRR